MPQPKRVQQLAEELLAFYGRSWERITRDEQALLNSWTGWNRTRRLARLRELRATVEALMDRADEQALRFTNEGLPEAYSLGAAAAGVGLSPFAQPDLDAIGVLANDAYSDLLAATGFVRDSTKTLVRILAREHVADKLVAGQTAVQAARDLARSLEGRGIAAVVYRDGSRHGLADYSSVVVRTKTAEAYTVGTMNQLDRAGIAYVEIFDGAGCGWTSHDDTDKANGTIRTLEEARAYPISHPRCRRSVGGRPDITSAREARNARPSTTAEQRADQAAAEMTRQEQAIARAQHRRGGSFTDRSARTSSAAHANVLSARQAKLAGRAAKVSARSSTHADAASRLVVRAKAAEPRLTALTTSLAEANGGRMAGLDFRLKTEESLTRKIEADVRDTGNSPEQIAGKIFDVNRYTTVFPEASYAESAQATIDTLRAEGHTLNVKNYWNNADNPYQGINVQVTSPTGEQWELQFHTDTSLDIKEGELHSIYEKARLTTDENLLRDYTAQSFDASSRIPVPPGVQTVG